MMPRRTTTPVECWSVRLFVEALVNLTQPVNERVNLEIAAKQKNMERVTCNVCHQLFEASVFSKFISKPPNCPHCAQTRLLKNPCNSFPMEQAKAKQVKPNLQNPVNWGHISDHCAINEQTPPIHSVDNNADVNPREKQYQTIYDLIQKAFIEKGTQLNLSCFDIDDDTAVEVAKLLPRLTQLNILELGANKIKDSAAITIASALSKLPQLQLLSFHNNQIGDSGAIAIAGAISNLTQLQQLNFYNNKIGDSGATAIAGAISNLTLLFRLNMANNEIGNSGAIAIANSINGLTQLNCLYLHTNKIGDTGAIAIANSLCNLTQMNYLLLNCNQIGDCGATAIAKVAAELTQLSFLYLFENKTSEPVCQELKRKLGNKLYIRDYDQ